MISLLRVLQFHCEKEKLKRVGALNKGVWISRRNLEVWSPGRALREIKILERHE